MDLPLEEKLRDSRALGEHAHTVGVSAVRKALQRQIRLDFLFYHSILLSTSPPIFPFFLTTTNTFLILFDHDY